jgi:cardiolipin synthase
MFRRFSRFLLGRFPALSAASGWLHRHRKLAWSGAIIFCHVLGALTSIRAILDVRTPQGAVAWAVSLNTFPYIAVPAYWVFGRSEFEGYVLLRRLSEADLSKRQQELARDLARFQPEPGTEPSSTDVMERLAMLPATRENHAELLIEGRETFESIFKSIAEAREYVLVQFYILRDDGLGRRLQEALIAKAGEGVRCYVLYDEIGSQALPDSYSQKLHDAGVEIRPFHTRKGATNRFQVNFRNHRKTVIVDGRVAFVGGHNVGDEYLGLDQKIGRWRDAHVKVTGPVALCVQVSWVEDWHWAAGVVPKLNWEPQAAPDEARGVAFCLPTGPADELETCTLFFLHAIHSAKKRIWIASPYFVPDEQFISALQLAALRGVDVRILVPANPDNRLVYLSGFTFLPELEKAGVHTWRYQDGFLHTKALLVDEYCAIGTANFDNRSFRLNFEMTMLFAEPTIVKATEAMFLADFAKSTYAKASEFTDRPWWFRFAARASRLMAPIQ